eukprot:6411779-Alexandrium_andersonii.AAC.1
MATQAEVYARGGVDKTAIEEIKQRFLDGKRKGGTIFKKPAQNKDEAAPAQLKNLTTRTFRFGHVACGCCPETLSSVDGVLAPSVADVAGTVASPTP